MALASPNGLHMVSFPAFGTIPIGCVRRKTTLKVHFIQYGHWARLIFGPMKLYEGAIFGRFRIYKKKQLPENVHYCTVPALPETRDRPMQEL